MASPSRRSAGGTRGLDYGDDNNDDNYIDDDDDIYIDDCDSKEYDCENYLYSEVLPLKAPSLGVFKTCNNQLLQCYNFTTFICCNKYCYNIY